MFRCSKKTWQNATLSRLLFFFLRQGMTLVLYGIRLLECSVATTMLQRTVSSHRVQPTVRYILYMSRCHRLTRTVALQGSNQSRGHARDTVPLDLLPSAAVSHTRRRGAVIKNVARNLSMSIARTMMVGAQ